MTNSVNWKTLKFAGPAFIPYKRLPKSVQLRIRRGPGLGRLSDDAEEAVVNYARLILANNKHTTNRGFNNNFFKDFLELLTTRQKDIVVQNLINFSRLDFAQILVHLKAQKIKDSTSAAKVKKREKNLELKSNHGFCKVDGKKVELGNWTVEPAGIFMGRPGNPKHGKIKLRVYPENVTINCSGQCRPPQRHQWGRKLTDPSQAWVAKYTNNLGQTKYIFFGNESKFRSSSDEAKFNAARNLGNGIHKTRAKYMRKIKSQHESDRQLGLAVYFIDNFALRVGNEKGKDDADTVGCTTLRKEHISVNPGNVISFDFKGKDSIRFEKEFKLPLAVYNAIKTTIEGKRPKDKVFHSLNSQDVNAYLKDIDGNPTAKVFRTFNASSAFQQHLLKMSESKLLSNEDKLFHYKKANLLVAKLCNHQKTVNKKAEAKTVARMQELVRKKKEKVGLLKRKMNAKNSHKMRINDQYLKAMQSLKVTENQLWLRENGVNYSLATSQANYLDPRITVAWSKANNIPLSNIWSKTLQKKFDWASNTSRHFRF